MGRVLQLFLIISIFAISCLFSIEPAEAANIAEQTTDFSSQKNSHRVIQELGDNLAGKVGSFTFRVSTSLANNKMFDYTAQNSLIYDKSVANNVVAQGCASEPTSDQLRGLTFVTEGVPAGFEDVIIDFSCNNFEFIPGHKYLISVGNAGTTVFSGNIQFTGATYLGKTVDYFPGGGMRYSKDNTFCSGALYIWNSSVNFLECYIWTTPKDDIYFILKNTAPDLVTKTPLIIIPGIGGSELKVSEDINWSQPDGHGGTFNHTYLKGEKVWVNEGEAAKIGADDYFDVLRMKPDGITPEANLELTGNLFAGAYQPTIDFFTSNGYELNKTLFVFPYDWRKDIILTAPLLDQKIGEIKSQTGSQKVDILAHSMGGLVSRYYISDPARAGNVRKLFTLGTPHLGSVQFLQYLRYGGCFTIPQLQNLPFCLGLTNSEVKDVVQNLIGGFQLAPSIIYFNFYSNEDNFHPYPYADLIDIDNDGLTGSLSYSQLKILLSNLGQNTNLFSLSETFHNLDNTLSVSNDVEVINIAGSGLPSLGQIIEKYSVNFLGIKIAHTDRMLINGDKTVPLFSASLNDPQKNLSLMDANKIFYTNQEHGGLITPGPALNLVKNILENNNQIPLGVSSQTYQLTGNQLSVHSPVNIHVYDSSGNHTGPTPNGDFEINIPGSSYDSLDDAKFVFLPDNGIYSINFEATNQGSFDFKIRKYENDVNTQTILYKNTSLVSTTKGQANFDTNSSESTILQIDKDGNGSTDLNINPFSMVTGSGNFDLVPPKTLVKLTGVQSSNGLFTGNVQVQLNGQDETNGSEVQKIEYTFDNGQTIQTYTNEFTITKVGKTNLKVRSIDKAGNEETPQIIDIEITSLFTIVSPTAEDNSKSSGTTNIGSSTNPPGINPVIASVLGTSFTNPQVPFNDLENNDTLGIEGPFQNTEKIILKQTNMNWYIILGGITAVISTGFISKKFLFFIKNLR